MVNQTNRMPPKKQKKLGAPFAFKGAAPLDRGLLATILIIVVFGLVMLFSVSYASGYYQYNDSFYYIYNQGKLAFGGIIVMFLASYVNLDWVRIFTWPLYAITIFLLIIVFFFTSSNDGLEEFHRWIYIGGSSFQPSEIAKFSISLTCAWLATRYEKKIRSNRFKEYTIYGIGIFMIALAPMAVLIYKEPHLSATVIMICITLIVMFMAGTNWRWCTLGIVCMGAGIATIGLFLDKIIPLLPEHAQPRLELWENPFLDPLGKGMQTVQGLYAIGSGGLKGLGIGNSRQKHLWVPEPYNDFIFSIICEELGFIGALIILFLFALLIFFGFRTAVKCPDRFNSLVAAGITGQVAVQVFFNIGVVTGLLPNTGISLPFFSYGGTSLLMLLGEMGILLAISRKCNEKTEEQAVPAKPNESKEQVVMYPTKE